MTRNALIQRPLMKKDAIPVLLSTIGCNTALSVAKSLRMAPNARYRIIGTDLGEAFEAAGAHLCDAHYRVPAIKDPAYVGSLLDICKTEGIKIVIPVIDQDVETLAAARERFTARGITVCCNALETARICNDKYLTYTFLKSKGFEVPRVLRKEDIKTHPNGIVYPAFLKPRRGISSINCFRIDNERELKFYMDKVADPILQPYLEGQHCVIDVVNGLDGKTLVAVPRYELSTKSGIGVKAVTVKDSVLERYGREIAEAVGIQGPANIEVYRHQGVLSLIEINCRFSAGHILTTRAGVNIPELAIDVFMNKPIPRDRLRWKAGLYMSRYWQEQFSCKARILT